MSLSRAMMSLSALVVLIALPRLIAQEEIAHFRKLWLLYGIAGPVLISAVVSTAYFRAGDGQRRSALGEMSVLAGFGGILVGLATWLLAPFMANHFMVPHLVGEYRLFALYSVLLVWVAVAEPLFVVTHHKRSLPFYTGFFSALDMVAVLVPFASGMGIRAALIGMIAAQGLRLPVLLLLYWKWNRALSDDGKGVWLSGSTLKYAVGMAFLALSGVGAVEVDRILVGSFLDDIAFALYDYGSRKIPFVTILTASVTSAIVAGHSGAIRSGDYSGAVARISAATNQLARGFGPPLLVTAAGAPALMAFVFGEEFRDAGPVFAIFLFALMSNLLFPHAFVLATGRSRVNVAGSLTELVVNIALSLSLLPYIGIIGVALASMTAHWIYVMVMMEYCRRNYGLSWSTFLPSGIPWWLVTASLLLAGGAWIFRDGHIAWFAGFVLLSGLLALGAVKNFRKVRVSA